MAYTYHEIGYPFDDIELVKETHLSVVFIGRRHVFKVKKAVHFAFVNYSTLAMRFEAAKQELLLNRRTTINMYRGLAFLKRVGDLFIWAGPSSLDGEPPAFSFDEVAVVMRRIDEGHTLSSLLEKDTPNDSLSSKLRKLSSQLADFHKQHVVKTAGSSYITGVAQWMRDNISELTPIVENKWCPETTKVAFQHVARFTEEFLSSHLGMLGERYREGRVADGHGDLRLDHICFEPSSQAQSDIQIFDCVEFNRDLRVNDGASEIGFLSMNLDFKWRVDLAHIVEQTYAHENSDKGFFDILSGFKTYRALVRAKVHAIRLDQLEMKSSEWESEVCKVVDYLALASRYTLGVFTPVLYVVCGIMGTGKSTVARIIQRLLHAPHLNSDVIRKTIVAAQSVSNVSREADYAQGLYSHENTRKTYREMLHQAEGLLLRGNPVILDATFGSRNYREAASAIAERTGARMLLIECVSPKEETLRRLKVRFDEGRDVSDARPELYDAQALQWEPVDQRECPQRHTIDTSRLRGLALAGEIADLIMQ